MDQAGRGVAAEQGALRPAQHFDPLDLAKLVEADARARAIDAVDEHRDRAFEAGIVADGADAANAGRAVGFGAGRRHEQRRGELVQLADVGRAGILHRSRADGGDGDRNVLEDLDAALRGDDDLDLLSGGRSGAVGATAAAGSSWVTAPAAALVASVGGTCVRLVSASCAKAGADKSEETGRQQPDGLAQNILPKRISMLLWGRINHMRGKRGSK